MLSIFLRVGALFDNWNADPIRQFPHRGWKIGVLIFHHEAKNAAPHTAAEAMKCLPLRTDMKRRRLFLMKRTERLKVCPGPFEGEVGADYFDDVIGTGDLLDCFRRNHVGLDFSLVCSAKRCQNLRNAEALSK